MTTEIKTRKAVVTMEQVQVALKAVNDVLTVLNKDHKATEFDRAAGRKATGFSEYDSHDNAIRNFETKEDALVYYRTFLDGMNAVISTLPKTETQESKPSTRRTKAAETAAA